MKVDQILELGKLGFSKNEIIGILNAQNMTGLNQITSSQATGQIQNLGQHRQDRMQPIQPCLQPSIR